MPVKDEEYVEYILSCKQTAEDARRPLDKIWDELWQLYQNKQDFSKKADWQSKAFVPKIFTQIFKSSGEVKRALMQMRKLFKIELKDSQFMERIVNLEEARYQTDDANEIGLIQKEIETSYQQLENMRSRMNMRERTFQNELSDGNFVPVYSEHLVSSFLLGLGVIKVLWSNDNKYKLENVDVKNFYISPDYLPFQDEKPDYVIEYKEMDLAKLKKLAKKKGSPYKNSIVSKIEEDMSKNEDEGDRRRRLGLGDYSKTNKKVTLLEFWGDIVHKDGTIEENQLIVLANEKYVIRHHDNVFNHKKPPYILTMPIAYPHRGICGISLVQPMAKLQYLYNNIINMIADNLNYSVNKIFEYNPSDLKNPRGLTVIYPGKTIATNTSQQAIREVVTSPVGHDAINFLGAIDKDMQESTSVTKPVTGVTDSTRKTLGQFNSELSQAKGTFDIIGRDLEQNSIKPLLEMIYDMYVQFAEYEDRKDRYVFVVGGVSAIMAQQELIERMREVMTFALQAPPITQMTNLNDLWKRFLSIYNLQDVYNEPQTMGGQMRPEQMDSVRAKAEEDAKAAVGQMSPEQIMKGGL